MPSMEYLLGEISVDGPEDRAEAVKFNNRSFPLEWPEGWWAVSDDQFAYLGFFQFEADAWAYRLYLVNLRMNAKDGQGRYAGSDPGIDAEEERMVRLQEAQEKSLAKAAKRLEEIGCRKGRGSRTSPSASKGKSTRSRPRTGITTSSGKSGRKPGRKSSRA